MECREALELLNDEIDGRLGAADALRVDEHVAGCAACAAERRSLASLRATFSAVPKETAPPGFRGDVMASLPRGRKLTLPTIVGWIAAAAAVFVVAVTLIPNGSASRETDVATVFEREAAPPPEASAAGPPPVVTPAGSVPMGGKAAPGEPVAPPRPGATAARAPRTEAKVAAEGDVAERAAEADAKRRDVADSPRPAPVLPPAPAKPGAPAEKTAAETAKDEDDATAMSSTLSGVAAKVPQVRYVVFRDAAAAERFANSLVASDDRLKKDKAKEAAAPPPATGSRVGYGGGGGGAGGPGPGEARKSGPSGGTLSDELRREVVKEAAFATRRIVASTPLPASIADADLAARVAAAGGALVSADEQPKFEELLDAPAAKPSADAAGKSAPPPAPPAKEERSRQAAQPPADAGAAANAETPVVVVVVVLEPAVGAKK